MIGSSDNSGGVLVVGALVYRTECSGFIILRFFFSLL